MFGKIKYWFQNYWYYYKWPVILAVFFVVVIVFCVVQSESREDADAYILFAGPKFFELGEKELEYHKQMGEFAAAQKADLLLCVGKLSFEMYMGAIAKGCRAMYFANKDILLRELPELLEDGDTIRIKASHSMHLEEVAAWLDENYD